MKKGKKQVSKFGNASFSFKSEQKLEEIFEDYPSFEFPYQGEEDAEKDTLLELEYTLKLLKFADYHPPKIDTCHGTNIYFTIVFESREQKDDFLHQCNLYRIGDKYLTGEEFANAFGIDLENCIINKDNKKTGMSFGNTSLNLKNSLQLTFAQNMNFGKKPKKKEVSEKLKEIRQQEKVLAKSIEWNADPEYILCICFKTQKEKENMLKSLNLKLEFNGKYLWCHDVANALGVSLVKCEFKNKDVYSGRERRLEEMV